MKNKITKMILILIILISVSNMSSASVILKGDYETKDISQWNYTECVTNKDGDSLNVIKYPLKYYPRYQILSNGARQGNYYIKFTAYPGDHCDAGTDRDRAGLVNLGVLDGRKSPNMYYGFSVKIPAGYYSNEWISIYSTGTKGSNRYNGRAEFGMTYESYSGQLGINIHRFKGSLVFKYPVELRNLKQGVWHDFIIHIKYARDYTGIVQVYHRQQYSGTTFKLVLDERNTRTDWSPYTDAKNEAIYVQNNVYRGYYINRIQSLYFDSHRMGTTYNDAYFNVVN